MSAVDDSVRLLATQWCAVVSIASYFPLTVAGAGAREAALVAVYRLVGVPEEKSLAAALAFFGCSLFVAATGGILNLWKPLK